MDKSALQLLFFDVVKNKQYHANYIRTVELAELYSKLVGGKDVDSLLKQFVRREDDALFEQRKRLTQATTPSICSTIIKTFNKVLRTTPAVEIIDFDGKDTEKQIQDVKDILKSIYGKKDIYKYIQDRTLYLSFADPNSFIYTTFPEFNANIEKPKPFNQEILSVNAMNYEYINNILQWLVSHFSNEYTENNVVKIGGIYTMYAPEWAFVLIQVGNDYKAQPGEVIEILKPDIDNREKDMYFIYQEYNHKSDVIPVIQIGYERDMETQGQTFVSPLNPGIPYLMKLVKAVSEFDLTMCLHAFPQKFQYVDTCTFKNDDATCYNSGKRQSECTICNKTGFKVHTTAQDAQLFKMPKDPADMINLSEIIHYEQPPIDILTFQDGIIDKWETKVVKSVFNSERYTKDQVAKTATGENVDMQNVYDTLKPFAEKVSDIWMHIAIVVSYYLDFKNPVADHAYPNDFKMKSNDELLDELTKAQGANGYIISSIETDIMRQKFIDDPLEFQKYLIKSKYYPFQGKTKDEIATIINSGVIRKDDIILYNYFETIFNEIEDEMVAKNEPWFYDLTPALQKKAITEKVNQYKQMIDSQNAITLG